MQTPERYETPLTSVQEEDESVVATSVPPRMAALRGADNRPFSDPEAVGVSQTKQFLQQLLPPPPSYPPNSRQRSGNNTSPPSPPPPSSSPPPPISPSESSQSKVDVISSCEDIPVALQSQPSLWGSEYRIFHEKLDNFSDY